MVLDLLLTGAMQLRSIDTLRLLLRYEIASYYGMNYLFYVCTCLDCQEEATRDGSFLTASFSSPSKANGTSTISTFFPEANFERCPVVRSGVHRLLISGILETLRHCSVVPYYDTRVELVVGRRRFKNTVRKTAIVYPHERAQLEESSSRTGVGLVDKIASRLVV